MPKVAPILGEGTAYDNAEYALQHARAALNDVMEDADGEILTDDWAGTWLYLNQAYRMLQHELANNGVETNVKETHMLNILPVTTTDPDQQVWISQSGYYDGSNNHSNPVLPADLLIPIRLWERFSNTNNPYVQVTPATDGIPAGMMQLQQFRYWDWRTDAIYLPGATQKNDLRLRYVAYYPELTGPTSVIPFRRLVPALAFMTAFLFANPRGGTNAGNLQQLAMTEIDQIVAQTTRKKQRRAAQKRGYGGRGGWQGFWF
jgi:hypothetical protein